MSHNSPSGAKRAATYRRIAQAADTDRPQPIMTLAIGGSVLKLRAAKVPRGPRPDVKRGKVTHFSAQSRGRLLDLLASIKQPALRVMPLFLTLTYPAVFPTAGAEVKRHLDMFLKRIKRELPHAAAIWKLEFQKRGAPHFHILLFGVTFLHADWLAKCWDAVVKSGDKYHMAAGTSIERIKSWRGVMWYASKYVAKVDVGQVTDGCGRFWGVMSREKLPIEIIECALTFQAFYRARRVLKRSMLARKKTQGRPCANIMKGKAREGPAYIPRLRSEGQGLKIYAPYSTLAQLVRGFT